jgi:hypothetical protein
MAQWPGPQLGKRIGDFILVVRLDRDRQASELPVFPEWVSPFQGFLIDDAPVLAVGV